MSIDGQGTLWHRNIAESFNRISHFPIDFCMGLNYNSAARLFWFLVFEILVQSVEWGLLPK